MIPARPAGKLVNLRINTATTEKRNNPPSSVAEAKTEQKTTEKASLSASQPRGNAAERIPPSDLTLRTWLWPRLPLQGSAGLPER
ncbi:hypothetical protein CEXT_260231 [Caerostris extrusa]|uniref:Uncharacterized protein n=1 Tax=Caerostris extrusa TaxID=172846 RepID=A0AAV4PVV4_CAEEX|nr:hypothetical protein CEXT_260231 [Caerostris extrusa]